MPLKKIKREAAAQRRPAKSGWKNRVFPAKRQAVWLKREALQTENALGVLTLILQIVSRDKINKLHTLHMPSGAELRRVSDSSPVKVRWGRDGGKGNASRAGGDRMAARRVVPVRR